MCLFRLSWSASLAEFEHVQLPADYAWFERLSRAFLNTFRKRGFERSGTTDCRGSEKICPPSVIIRVPCVNLHAQQKISKEKLIGSRRSDPRARNHHRQTDQRLLQSSAR